VNARIDPRGLELADLHEVQRYGADVESQEIHISFTRLPALVTKWKRHRYRIRI
jgi:hypothetical protein